MIQQPLVRSRGEIRLLTPQPIRLHYDGSAPTLCYGLRNVPLDACSKYDALSYVWGEEAPAYPIIINEQEVSIRSNLYSALWRVREDVSDSDLWCDALCIDQKNDEEKNHEVLRMGDIYSRAQNVIIWLGEYARNSDRAIEHIERWGALYETLVAAEDGVLPRELASTIPDSTAWEATTALFDRPWWQRIWTLQEVALSRSATLLCGSDHCDWESFMLAKAAWERLDTPTFTQHLPDLQLPAWDDVGAAALTLQHQKLLGSRKSLLSLLRLTSTYNASNPRDKLYGLLGLREILDVTIFPNYGDSVRKVYTDLVGAFVRDTKRLSILAAAGIRASARPEEDLPSWVPELRIKLPMVDEYTLFSAAGQTDAVANISSDSCTLSAKGIVVAAVERLSPRIDADVLGRTDWVDMILALDEQYHPTGIPHIQAYFRTLIADSSNQALRQDEFPGNDAGRFYELAIGFLYVMGELVPRRSKVKQNFPRLSREQKEQIEEFNDYVQAFAAFEGVLPAKLSEEDILEPFLGSAGSTHRLHWPSTADRGAGWNSRRLFAHAMANACRDRSLFITQQGYIGLAPPRANLGDLVCIIYGCELPLILRKEGTKFVLIGPCYVYGLMHGEAIQQAKSKEWHTQEFDLV